MKVTRYIYCMYLHCDGLIAGYFIFVETQNYLLTYTAGSTENGRQKEIRRQLRS